MNTVSAADLSRLQPLRALGAESLERLPALCERKCLNRGEALFQSGEAGKVAYGLHGEIAVERRPGLVEVIVGGHGRGLWPVWRDGDLPVSARAITPVDLLLVDSEGLDRMVIWDQLASPGDAAVASTVPTDARSTAAAQGDQEWSGIGGLLAEHSLCTGVFANVPVANLHSLLQRLERVDVKRGDVVIEQGAAGDYYYLIQRGRCRVTRTIGGAPVELAELGEGDGFGEEALVSEAARNATVVMKTDGVLRRLAKVDFVSLLKEPLLLRVGAHEAQRRVASGAVWLDVRFPAEFQHDGIHGAINIPLNEIRQAAATLGQGREYVVYCQTGRRSAAAAFLLSQRGVRACVLEGGLSTVQSITRSVA